MKVLLILELTDVPCFKQSSTSQHQLALLYNSIAVNVSIFFRTLQNLSIFLNVYHSSMVSNLGNVHLEKSYVKVKSSR